MPRAEQDRPLVCMMFGRARSGTTVLRSMLNSHPEIRTQAEVFNSGGPYFQFLEDQLSRNPSLCQPEHSLDMFRAYVAWVRKTSRGKRVVVLDIKRECLHVVYRGWNPVGGAPAVLEETREQGWHALHLTRRNHLRRLLSNERARARGVYHRPVAPSDPGRMEAPGETPVRLSTHRLVAKLDELEADRLSLGKFFVDHENYLEIDYDEMFEASESGTTFSASVVQKLATFFGLEPEFDPAPRESKLSAGSLPEMVENYEEVETALRGTRYEELLS